MTIYVDVVLIENLCMNYIILFATAYIAKLKIYHLKILISSLIGAVYAILVYANVFPLYSNLIVKIMLSMSMVYIAFKPRNMKIMFKELMLFYLISFSLGGCAFALLYIVRPQEILMKNGVYIGLYPIKIILLGGIVGFVVTYIAFNVVKTRANKKRLIYDIEIQIEDEKLETKLILDTGNMLKDPISNDPVILIEKEKLSEILPCYLLNNIEKIGGGDDTEIIEEKYKSRLRVIPFTSVGKLNGMMIGIKADKVKIFTEMDEIIRGNVIVCSYQKKFSKANKYFGLMGLDLLERSEKNESFEIIKR